MKFSGLVEIRLPCRLRAATTDATTTRMFTKKSLSWSAITLAAVSGLAAAWPAMQGKTATAGSAEALAAEFCATSPAEAHVDSTVAFDRRFDVAVPAETPEMGAPSSDVHSIAKGDVIQFVVASGRPGLVAVHGLLDVQQVQVGGTTTVSFRAIYTGRFPLHFHGTDGSHFEIAALEVLPRATASVKLQPLG